MAHSKDLDRRADELDKVVRDIVTRFETANHCAANGPHCDLTMQELRVVEFLLQSGGQMMRAVAEYLGVAVNSLTSIADGLERKGLLRRVRSESDRRVVHVELTEEGQSVADGVRSFKSKFHREMLAALTEEEQAILLVLLRKIGGNRVDTAQSVVTTDRSPSTNGHSKSSSSRTDAAHRKPRKRKTN